MRRSRSLLLGSFSALVLLLSCVDGDEGISPAAGGAVRIPLAAQVSASAADASARPINRIRAVGRAVPGGEVLGEATVNVDPTDDVWDVPLELRLEGLITEVVVDIVLLHVDAAGAESVEYSGRVGPIAVRPGVEAPPVTVPVVRGPPENIGVTAVDITNAAPALLEGASRTLQATVTSNPPATPTVFWTSLSPANLSFNGAVATALLPGTATVVATAGPVSDTAVIQIVQRPAGVTINPTSTSADLGTEVVFTGAVVDPRGTAIAGQSVLWRSLDPSILEALTAGRFRAIGAGSGRAEARAAADTTLKAVGTVRVTRRAVDVAVTKSTVTTTALVGDAVVFTVGVANQGDLEAVNVRVQDQMPAGLTLEGASPSVGTFDAATGTWTVGNLAAGSRATLELRTRVSSGSAGQVITNTAEKVVSDDQQDPNAGNDRASASFTIGARLADLALEKTGSRATILEGDTVTFTVSVTNGGNQPVANLAVADSLPAGLTIVSDVATRGAFERTLRVWSVGTLAPGESMRLVIVARAASGSGATTQTNVARILSWDGPTDPNPDNNRATAAVGVQVNNQADVAVTKTVAVASLLEGDTATFTLKVKNLGPLSATGVEVKDSVGAGLTYVAGPAPARGTFSANTMIWTLGTLTPGDSALYTVRAVVNAGTTGQTLTNTARYLAGGPVADGVAGNNTATASVTVVPRSANVEVVKAVDVATPIELAPVRFTVTVSNLGPNDVTNLRIRDKLPSGLVLDSLRTTVGTVAGDSLWTIPSLPVSASAVMLVYVRVNAVSGTTITNQASRIGMDQSDPVPGNDVGSATITVERRKLDLEVRKTASVAQPTVGSAFQYRVTVLNHGPGSATSVQVLDTIPAQLTLDSVRTTTGTFASSSWSIATIAQSDSAVLTAYMRVPQAASGQTISNRARRAAQAQNDTNAVNDLATVTQTIPVNNPPVVAISAPPNQAVYDPGDTITFTATASDQEDGPLTAAIVWTSNVSGAMGTGGTVMRSNLAPGPHLVIASVTDSQGNVAADTVPIVIAIVTTPTSLNVPFGGSASMPISLSAPAPAGGLVLTITSADTTKVRVLTPSVTIPAGALSANAQLSGVLPGPAVVTAATSGFGSSSTNVSVTASLQILNQTGSVISSLTFPRGTTATIQVRLESQGVQIAAPAGGVSVALGAASGVCLAATSPITIPAGQVQASATLSYGGDASSPCTTRLTATATSITSDSINVTVNPPPTITLNNSGTLGSGLMYSTSGFLDYQQHGGVTVRITSTNPSLLLVSQNTSTAGAAFVDIPISNGNTNISYTVHALEGVTGIGTLVATNATFAPDTLAVTIVQPSVRIGSSSSVIQTTLSPDAPIYAIVGVSDCCGGVIGQAVRAGATPLTATFSVSDSARARLTNTAGSASTRTAAIAAGQSNSPTSVGQGGVAVDFLTAGSPIVSVSIPGFTQVAASLNYTITAPAIQVSVPTVGAGLQVSAGASLLASGHGGVTVHVESSDTTRMLVSPNSTTPGTGAIDVVVTAGQTFIPYYVQGVEGTTGTPRVRVSAPGFVTDSATVTVAQPSVRIQNLSTSYTSLTADQQFYVMVGLNDFNQQAVRAGGQALTATLVSSDSTKARLVKTGDSGDTITVTVPVGSSNSPTSVAAGGPALDFLAAGTTSVTVSIPGFTRGGGGTVNVTVTSAGFSTSAVTVGAGLQTSSGASLDATNHGGVTVTLTSSDTTRMLLSPNQTTAGTGSISVVVPNGQSFIQYYVQGIAGTTGTAQVRMSAPGFTPDSATVNVVQAALTFVSLPSATTTLTPNSEFYVYVGIPGCCSNGLAVQQVRAGGPTMVATVTSSVVGVGQIVTAAGSSGTGTVSIPAMEYRSPNAALFFDPVGAGMTTVAATIPGLTTLAQGNMTVTVSSPGITLNNVTVGGGLMVANSINLGASGHGGVTVRIRSSSGSIAQVAANATSAGADSVDIPIPAGQSNITFYVHGVFGATGTVTFTASAPGFTDGSGAMTVVQPALILTSLSGSYAAAGADDLFTVVVGTPSGNSVNSQSRQGGAAPLVATVTSSQPSVGTLVTSAGAGPSRTVNIAAGSSGSPGSIGLGGIAFDPIAAGSTSVTATIPGFITQPNGTVAVTVTP